MTSSLVLRAAGGLVPSLAALASLVVGCSSAHFVAEDAGPGPADAGPGVADAPLGLDAVVLPDASPGPDALAPSDAGPRGGCFDGALELWASSVGPSERAHARVLAAAAHAGGWLVAVTDLTGQTQLISTGPGGEIRSVSDIELYGQPARAFVVRDALVLFFGYEVRRFDLGADGSVEGRPSVYLGLSAARPEGILAVQPREAGDGFSALSLHYDTAASRYLVRYSEVRLDPIGPSGLAQVSGTLEEIPDLDLASARYFLDRDHVRVFARSGAWHVRDVQLGLGGIGIDGGTVGVRVWSDVEWTEGPDAVLDMTRDRRHVLTARIDPVTSAYVGNVESLPPATAAAPPLLGAGVALGFGTPHASMSDDDARVAIATAAELGVFSRDGGGALGAPTSIGAATGPLAIARQGDDVAVAFVADAEERRIALRCVALPVVP